MAMQPTTDLQAGGSIPSWPTAGGAGRSVPRSNPSEHKLFLTPPPKKSVIQFQGIKASESKNPLGDHFIGQNIDFTRGWTSNIMLWGMLRK